MSELPPADRQQHARGTRARRARARRANKTPSASLASTGLTDEALDEPTDEPTLASSARSEKAAASGQSGPIVAAAVDTSGVLARWHGLTPLSKQILIWASIVGVANVVLSVGTNFFLNAFGGTTAQQNANAGLLNGAYCLSAVLSLVALPFIGGWRATARQGIWKQGGMTGFWSVIIAEALGLIISVIIAAATGNLNQISGNALLGELENLVIPAALSFAFGAAGGSYSVWQRRRAQQRQEALGASS